MTTPAPTPSPSPTRHWLALWLALAAFATPASSPGLQAPGSSPSLIVHNAAVYTVNPSGPWAEAVAIENGVITAVGSESEVLALAAEATVLIDAGGRMVMPGLHDVHTHIVEAGMNRSLCELPEGRSLSFYETAMRDCARRQAGDAWVTAYGPWIPDLREATESPLAALDRAVPDRPAYVLGLVGHSVWVNSRALAAAGINADSPDPKGGVFGRDPATGELTGLLFEAAQYLIYDPAEAPSPENHERAYNALLQALRSVNRNGITSVSDAGGYWTRDHHLAWLRAQSEGTLTVRASNALFVYPYLDVREQLRTITNLFSNEPDSLLRFNQAKIYVDGIPSLGTAATVSPYAGDPAAGRGFLYFSRGRLRRYSRRLQAAGFQLHLHATGDRGVRLALDTLEATGDHTDRRNRVTHVFLVRPEDRPRFAELGAVADFQMGPETTAAGYAEFLLEMVGEAGAEPLPARSLLDSGARVVLSSDWDAEPVSPFGTLERSLTRPSEALPDLATAVRMITIEAAYLLHQEDRVGSIVPGKLADLIVLDRNLFAVPVDEIGGTQVMLTLLAGDEVYRRAGF